MGLSAADYLFGVAELAAVVAALAFGAVLVRAWLLPEWNGAPARLVEALLAVAALVWLVELLGGVGVPDRRNALAEALVLALKLGEALLLGLRVAPVVDEVDDGIQVRGEDREEDEHEHAAAQLLPVDPRAPGARTRARRGPGAVSLRVGSSAHRWAFSARPPAPAAGTGLQASLRSAQPRRPDGS